MAAPMDRTVGFEDASNQPLLESLTLPFPSPGGSTASPKQKEHLITCLFCESSFDILTSRDEFLKHLVLEHKLVIADFRQIPDFEGYITHWRQRFSEKSLTDFCSVIQTNSKETDSGPKELYYLLCDALPEDKELRLQLQKDKLQEVLTQQQTERQSTTFSFGCLFCRDHFTGNRANIFNHMAEDHNFNVGHPDNLVYTTEFLQLLQNKLDSMKCLYCEKTFKDRHVLKEHMRKKQHKKINCKNCGYDKFYVINYLEFGKNWEAIQSEDDKDLTDADSLRNDDWGDWEEEQGETNSEAVCLFCTCTAPTSVLMDHMKEHHGFDMRSIKDKRGLNFYQQVKLVNYIRRQVHKGHCPGCGQKFDGQGEDLEQHLSNTGHVSQIPEVSTWDQPEYFFPTYENDNLLCVLDDEEEEGEKKTGISPVHSSVVIAEDIALPDTQARQVMSELLCS